MTSRLSILIQLCCLQNPFAELIPLERALSGCPWLVVNVPGAENNPQRLLIDTGSTHSYLLQHSMMRNLGRAGELNGRIAGIRGSLIPADQLSRTEATHINYDQFAGLRLLRWTKKRFTSGAYSWSQKFAVAVLPDSQMARWDPRRSGLVGAGPRSKFAETHRRFGIIPRQNGDTISIDLFVNEPINPEWCREGRIVYAPVTNREEWFIQSSSISFRGSGLVMTVERFEILADTGYGSIRFPPLIFGRFRTQLESLNISSLRLVGIFLQCNVQDFHLIPDLIITLVSGATITIPKKGFSTCFSVSGRCDMYIAAGNDPNVIIVGVALFDSLIVEFDSSVPDHSRIGFCEPISSVSPHPLVTLGPGGVEAPAPPPVSNTDAIPSSPIPPVVSVTQPRNHQQSPKTRPVESPDWKLIEPLRLPNDLVEDDIDEDSSDRNSADSTTKSADKFLLPVAILVITNILMA